MFTLKGPLADLLPRDAAASAPSHASANAAEVDPIDVLGWMLQLRGTVVMSSLLDERRAPPRPAHAGQQHRGEAPPLWRFGSFREMALRPLRNPFAGRHGLAEGPALAQALAACGALGRRRRRDVDRVAEQAAGRFHQFIDARISIARAGAAELRGQLREHLREAGPAATYLEQLDTALRAATEERARQLFGRIAPALHRQFGEQLWQQAQALPDPITAADVALWYARGGWIHNHLRACRRAIVAVCAHEERALEALVAAGHQLAITTENDS